MGRSRWMTVVVAWVVVLCVASPAWAQRAKLPPEQAPRALGPAEIQRLFDAYTVVQAQDALALDDEQFGRFLPRLKALQHARRRFEMERQRLTGELARTMVPAQNVDEARIREQLNALAAHDVRGAADIRAASDALEQMLDIRRQARFKVFELQMERRKFELVLRARRAEAGRVQRDKD